MFSHKLKLGLSHDLTPINYVEVFVSDLSSSHPTTMTSLFVASPQPKPSKDYLVATNDNTSVFVRRSDVIRYQVRMRRKV